MVKYKSEPTNFPNCLSANQFWLLSFIDFFKPHNLRKGHTRISLRGLWYSLKFVFLQIFTTQLRVPCLWIFSHFPDLTVFAPHEGCKKNFGVQSDAHFHTWVLSISPRARLSVAVHKVTGWTGQFRTLTLLLPAKPAPSRLFFSRQLCEAHISTNKSRATKSPWTYRQVERWF